MTRKKSNVKALALAVTCAILAGGYSGLNPVYAAENVTYDSSTKKISATSEITQLEINGVFIGTNNTSGTAVAEAGRIEAKKIKISDYLGVAGKVAVNKIEAWTGSEVDVNGTKFASSGAITASSLALGSGDDAITDVAAAIKAKASQADLTALQTTVGTDENSGLQAKIKTNASDISNLKTTVGDNNSGLVQDVSGLKTNTTGISYDSATSTTTINKKTIINGEAQAQKLTLKESGGDAQVLTAEKLKSLNTAVGADGKLTGADGSTVGGVGFDGGAVTNVKSINGAVEISTDGKTVTFNKGNTNGQVQISENGIKVGTGSTYISGDAVYTGGADYDNAKAGMKNDGSLKAAGGLFTVNGTNGNTTVGGTLNVTGDTTLGNLGVTGNATVGGKLTSKGNFSVGNNNEFTVDAATGNVVTKGGVQVGTGSQQVLLGGGGVIATNGTDKVTLANGAVVATGAVTGSVIQDSAGAQMSGGNVTAKGALSAADGQFTVNGTSGLVTFGNDAGNQSTIAGKTATFGTGTGDQTVITGGAITAKSLTVDSFGAATITATDTLKVGTKVSLNKDGDLVLGANTLTNAQLGNINATIQPDQAIAAKSATIGGVQFSTNREISNVKNITAEEGKIGEVDLEGGKITANNGGTIAGVSFATGGVVTGVSDLTATGTVKAATLKVNDNNVLDSNGLEAEKAVIDNITIDGASITSNNAEGSVGIAGITVDKHGALTGVNSIDSVKVAGGNPAGGLTIGDGATAVTIGGNSMALSSTNFGVDNDGDVAGQSFTAGSSSLKNGELKLNDENIWTTAGGIKAEKATIGANTLDSDGFSTTGTLDVAGKATFGSNAANRTTIEQGAVSITQNGKTTTIKGGEIETDKLTVNDIVLKNSMKDGAGNTITISGTDGSLSVASGKFKVDEKGQVTNEYNDVDAAGKATKTTLKTSVDGINANYTNAVNGNNNLLAIDKDGVALGVTDSTDQKLGGFAANKDNASLSYGANNSIVVNANTIKSALGTDVSTTLTNNGTDQSIVNKVTDNATSTIKADSIVNKVGSAKRSLKADEIVDEVANNSVTTDADGTTFTDGTTSTNINGSSITSSKSATDKGVLDGSNLTLNDGTNETKVTAGGATFTKDGKTTTIDGDTITTGKLVTDELVITGSGNAAGDGGSIAFGGNGTIKSNIKGEVDTPNEGKETTFETKLDGVTTTVTDGTATSENTQTATSIGGVVTNGTVKIAQTLDGENGNITNEVTDKDGKSSKLVQNGTGLEYTDSTKADNATRINSSDVSIGSATDDSKRINLSDLGQIDDLDSELSARDEFTSNKTAVGGINAEAAIRREEVARLDNRIDDVNNRVDKVGAMAAAIASLKSIGYDPQAPSEFSVGLGQYKGETGVALGFFHYPNKNFMINVSLSTAGGETMGGIGATWRFGHKSPQKLLDEQRAAQAKKELAAAEKYKAAAQLAKEAQERAEYAAKLARQAQVSADNARAAADATQAKHFSK